MLGDGNRVLKADCPVGTDAIPVAAGGVVGIEIFH